MEVQMVGMSLVLQVFELNQNNGQIKMLPDCTTSFVRGSSSTLQFKCEDYTVKKTS